MDNLKELPQIKNLSSEEKKVFYSLLASSRTEDGLNLDKIKELYYTDYDEIPVTIDKFLEEEKYLGKVFNHGDNIYPFWRQELYRIFHENPDHAFEIALTGAIGQGKSTIAVVAMLYFMYQVLCLKNPQEYYGLTANAPIVFVCLNLTLDLAWSGLYSMAVSAMQMSPWFMEKCDIRGTVNYTVSFPNHIELMCASSLSHVIGKNVICALMDEINFSRAPKGSQKNVMDLYRGIRRRVESRFMRAGRVYGYIVLISSKNGEQDFLDQYIQTLKGNKSTIVIDEPIWNVKPPETYIGEKFKVAVGDKTKASRILSEYDDPNVLLEQGYNIIEVPVEYKVAFEQDIITALCDIAGISSFSTSKLIPYAGKIEACISRDKRSPFMTEIIHMGLDSDEDIKDYLDELSILRQDMNKPRFLHVDIGLKNDKLGIGCVHNSSQTMVKKFTPEGNIEELVENIYTIDFAIAIQSVPGSEIPLYKVREFFLWLADYIGWKIPSISYDGFQSADSLQLLKVAGFDTHLTSVDRSADPYLNMRSCILDNRLIMYNHELLKEELYNLEYDKVKNKVDHPLEGCFSGDTKLLLVDNHKYNDEETRPIAVSFKELTDSPEKYSDRKVLSVTEEGKSILTDFKSPRITKFVREIMEVELETGEIIKCTPEHRFLCRDTEGNFYYVEAQNLTEDCDIVEPFIDDEESLTPMFQKFSSSKVCTLAKGFLYKKYMRDMYSLCMLTEYGFSKTMLNHTISSWGVKRCRSEAQKVAISQGRGGSITLRETDEVYKHVMREIGLQNIRNYNQRLDVKRMKSQRLKEYNKLESTRVNVSMRAKERWRDPVYRDKVCLAGNKGWGVHQYYQSTKADKIFYLKSNVEKSFIQLVESIPRIKSIEYESICIDYNLEGEERVYIPDFLLTDIQGNKYLIEVKYKTDPHRDPKLFAKYLSAMSYCESKCWKYLWVTKADIRRINWEGVFYEG